MVGGFLHRLLGRSAPLPPEILAALAELDRLEQERPSLGTSVALLRAVLPILYAEPAPDPAPRISPEEATIRLGGAMPLLRGEQVPLDGRVLKRRWQQLCNVVEHQQRGSSARALAAAVKQGRLDLEALTRAILAGHSEAVHAQLDSAELDAGFAGTVFRFTLFPALSRISAELAPLREGARWTQGFCPVCGSWPLLGEYRGLEQLRWLRCGLCAAEWEFPRLRCLFCATDDHQALGYFHVEGEESRHRAATCDACRGYVKMVNTLTALTGPQLLVADVATLHLDLAAADRGFGQS